VKKFGGFLLVTVALCCVGAWGITLAVPGRDVSRAVWTSAVIVMIVQPLAFQLVRLMGPLNVIAGWGLGSMLRGVVLIVFGFFGVKAMGLSMEPALLSMAGFFFVSTVIEPVFLKP
jgi:hypothetical protein